MDYWSDAPAEIQAITNQEAYNAAVQTLKDQDIIRDPDVMEDGINPYYNYAVFRGLEMFTPEEEKQVNVTAAIGKMYSQYNGVGTKSIHNNGDGTFDKVIIATAPTSETAQSYVAVIDPILATLNDSMSDKEKAEVLVKAICDRFVYSTNSMFDWPDPVGSAGACVRMRMLLTTFSMLPVCPVCSPQVITMHGTTLIWTVSGM